MGIFNKLFGKKETEKVKVQLNKGDTFITVDNNTGFKIIRPLSNKQRNSIEKSTILLRTGQLYMHYWTDNLICKNPNDQEWQNKVMFFWKAEEPFPKKSLPKEFEDFKVKYFLFQDTSKISLQVGQAIPWFGMPGLGEKHVCELNSKKITIPELNKLGIVDYFEQIELTENNLNVLTNKEEYFFLIDERITPFQNGSFQLKGKPIPISVAYEIGGIHLMKKSKQEVKLEMNIVDFLNSDKNYYQYFKLNIDKEINYFEYDYIFGDSATLYLFYLEKKESKNFNEALVQLIIPYLNKSGVFRQLEGSDYKKWFISVNEVLKNDVYHKSIFKDAKQTDFEYDLNSFPLKEKITHYNGWKKTDIDVSEIIDECKLSTRILKKTMWDLNFEYYAETDNYYVLFKFSTGA